MRLDKLSFRQIVTNYKDLAITDINPAVVYAADAQKKQMKTNKSGFTWFYNFISVDNATADAKNAFF